MSAINVGDLVQVIKQPHIDTHKPVLGAINLDFPRLGEIFRVDKIYLSCKCSLCGAIIDERSAGIYSSSAGRPFSWLKKIPPLEELEGKQDKHDIPVFIGKPTVQVSSDE